MSTSLLRVVERAQQDAEQGPEAIQSNGLRRVSAPPTPTGRGPARSAHETLGRTLQLLRSERQPSKSGPSGSRHATGLAKMAAPSQPAHASHVGAVQPIVGTLPASPAAGCGADMGGVATRHISGGAGWWKSPCPVLVRASGEQSPGATRPVTGTPGLKLQVENGTTLAIYQRGSGTTALVFVWNWNLWQLGEDHEGVSIPAGNILLREGSIQDDSGNVVDLAHTGLPTQSGHRGRQCQPSAYRRTDAGNRKHGDDVLGRSAGREPCSASKWVRRQEARAHCTV